MSYYNVKYVAEHLFTKVFSNTRSSMIHVINLANQLQTHIELANGYFVIFVLLHNVDMIIWLNADSPSFQIDDFSFS